MTVALKQKLDLKQLAGLSVYHNSIYNNLLNHEAKIAVVGLGYVGLPLALEFARDFKVTGFDISQEKIDLIQQGIDPCDELESYQFQKKYINYTANESEIADARFYVVAVPTPIDKSWKPNLRALKSATASVASVLKKGDYVVFESTVYPGCTEEVCLPILESISGLEVNKDFKIGYSPERINPGDKENTLTKIKKIVSGSDKKSLEEISKVYRHIILAGIHEAPSIKVAEAAKIIENTQRDVNIALMNELSIIFEKLGVNTFDVLEAAGTKWNFLPFQPGLVGGHCISVDPYYLIEKAKEAGVDPKVIQNSRLRNETMPLHLANLVSKKLQETSKHIRGSKILIQGITFKPNVTDIRNSKVADLYECLTRMGASVEVTDPLASRDEVKREFGIDLIDAPTEDYDVVIVAVDHKEYKKQKEVFFEEIGDEKLIIVDLKSALRGQTNDFEYFSL